MSPEEYKAWEDRVNASISDAVDALSQMEVTLSSEPQTEPFAYIHEKVEEIHHHSSYLTDLIVRFNREKAQIDLAVGSQKHLVESKFSEALVNVPEIRNKRTAAERKAAASLEVKEDKSLLLELKHLQVCLQQVCKSLNRKAQELKAKSIDLKLQYNVMELEWNQAQGYGSGKSRKKKKSKWVSCEDEGDSSDSVSVGDIEPVSPNALEADMVKGDEDLDTIIRIAKSSEVQAEEDLDSLLSKKALGGEDREDLLERSDENAVEHKDLGSLLESI